MSQPTTVIRTVRETQLITAIINGTSTLIPAYQTANITLFPTTTTKAPATTVTGIGPPPPFGSSPSGNGGSNEDSRSITLRNWGLVVLGLVVLAFIGVMALRRYRSGRSKKQEPGTFMTVGEDDLDHDEDDRIRGASSGGGHAGGGGGGGGGGAGINLAILGGAGGSHGHSTTDATIRERRNSVGLQPIPRAKSRLQL
ncbi:hypothetical protein BGZ94_010062 [Podila epigama]|nr:hypothetical protein BGZ94_010062 [Podila epigama]